MGDESHDDLEDVFSDLIADARGAGQDTKTLTDLRKAYRRAVKDGREAEARGYERAKQELASEQASRQAFDRLKVPAALQGLFSGIDPTDTVAMDAKVADLRAAGITWQAAGDTPTTQQQPDPMAAQVAGMAAATSGGGGTPDPAGDLAALAKKAETDPAAADQYLAQVNAMVRAAGQQGAGAGILG